jgi:xanthine dehydrogenase large subunit
MLAISVREAIRDAVAAFGQGHGEIALASPATSEAIWMAIQKVKAPNSKHQHPENDQASNIKDEPVVN